MVERTPNAFAEATGGAIGAVWSTLLFYPADVAKIRLQAEADAHEEAEEAGEGKGGEEGGSSPLGAAAIEAPTTRGAGGGGAKGEHKAGGGPKSFLGEILVVLKRPDLWYAGLGLKLQLAIVSTFVYFYVYTSLKRAYAQLLKRPVTFLPNLALNSLAGVANILLTLPLDVVVTRMQVVPQGNQRPTFREMVRIIWEEEEDGGAAAARARKGPQRPVGAHEAFFWRLTRFWHGLLPALILTSNPAINYACYDALKAVVPIPPGKKRHGLREMFVIGMLSKFVATVITYPLIRAKVMMMAGTKRLRAPAKQQQQQHEEDAVGAEAEAEVGELDDEGGGATAAAGGAIAATSSSSSPSSSPATSSASPPTPSGSPSFSSPGSGAGALSVLSPSLQLIAGERQGLLEIMRQLVQEGGVSELYVGLDGQVINTALKNAVLMNTKDRISRVTAFVLRRLFGAAAL